MHLRRGLKTADDDDGIVVETLSSESFSRGVLGDTRPAILAAITDEEAA
jgi:hypothetical protein